MEPTVIFKIANSISMIGWIVMAVLHHRPLTYKIIFNGIVLLLCMLYASVIVWSFTDPQNGGNFSSLEGVMTLFKNPKAVLAGWVHYLAFDMMVGLFIVQNSAKNEISRWLVMPCLFFNFMFGPVGLLLYYILLSVKKRNPVADIF